MSGVGHPLAEPLTTILQRCESAPNRDPGQKRYNALMSLEKFVRRGVPIGADQDPLNRSLLPFVSIA